MSVNKVILIGNVGRDPEVRYFEGGDSVASFSLATTERGFTNRAGAQVPEKTEWHNIVAWRGLAQLSENYIRKGSQIYIEGKLRTRSFDDQSGVKQYRTEIYADVIQLLGKKDGEISPLQANTGFQQNQQSVQNLSANSSSAQSIAQSALSAGADNDDLPF